ncbi:MAG: ATP-binding protein [Cryomorphaceae bacterium]|nr:ATP-binding protein [Flavobacteriales bacterium]
MITREAQSSALEILDDFPCLGIIGPRQIGKTTLAHSLAQGADKPVVYLDLESTEDLQKLSNAESYLRSIEDSLVVIDEIQRMKSLFPLLRSIIDRHRIPGRFIVLGSASPELIRESSESLAGRIAYLELGGITCPEIGWENQHDRWLKGGYPAPLLQVKNRFTWFENYIRTYVERDLPMLGLPALPNLSLRLIHMLSHIQGSTLNYSNLSRSLEITDKTVKRYLDFLEESFLITQLQAYSTNSRKRLVKAPKVYIRDSGLLHYLQGIDKQDALSTHPIVGASWEGFVIEQIKAELPKNYHLFYFRTHQGHEVDLVITRAYDPVAAIEIKYGDKVLPSKSNETAAQEIGAKHKFLIHSRADSKTWTSNNEWIICSLKYFIEKAITNL